jgi:LAO/AO transport system kinase
VGQTELDVLHVADEIYVVLVPESGDSIQAMKAGLSEIADVFVVNKADRPGAASLVRELEAAAHLSEQPPPPIFQTVATRGDGVEALMAHLETRHLEHRKQNSKAQDPAALREEAKALLRVEFETHLEARVQTVKNPQDLLAVLLELQNRSAR